MSQDEKNMEGKFRFVSKINSTHADTETGTSKDRRKNHERPYWIRSVVRCCDTILRLGKILRLTELGDRIAVVFFEPCRNKGVFLGMTLDPVTTL